MSSTGVQSASKPPSRPAGWSTFVGQIVEARVALEATGEERLLGHRSGRTDEAALLALLQRAAGTSQDSTARAVPPIAAIAARRAPTRRRLRRRARAAGGSGTDERRPGSPRRSSCRPCTRLSRTVASGSAAPSQPLEQRLQPLQVPGSRWIRKSAKREKRPSSAPSGQSTRQKKRGTTRFRSSSAAKITPISHAPENAGRGGGVDARKPAARSPTSTTGKTASVTDRVRSAIGSSRPIWSVPRSAAPIISAEDPVLQLVELAVAVAVEALLRRDAGSRASA